MRSISAPYRWFWLAAGSRKGMPPLPFFPSSRVSTTTPLLCHRLSFCMHDCAAAGGATANGTDANASERRRGRWSLPSEIDLLRFRFRPGARHVICYEPPTTSAAACMFTLHSRPEKVATTTSCCICMHAQLFSVGERSSIAQSCAASELHTGPACCCPSSRSAEHHCAPSRFCYYIYTAASRCTCTQFDRVFGF
jgi:hypothetical protein